MFTNLDAAADSGRRYHMVVPENTEQAATIYQYSNLTLTLDDFKDTWAGIFGCNRERVRKSKHDQCDEAEYSRTGAKLLPGIRVLLQEQAMSDRVTVEIRNHVAEVTLNRPEKHNAVDLAMIEALIAAGESLADDTSVRAVVLHGAGENFCAGIDLSVFQGAGIDGLDKQAFQPRDGSPANFFQSAAYVWRALPVPVIAAIRGVAFGAGLQIALGADIRYATSDARFSIMEIKWGIIPDMAITLTLRDVMPVDRIKELAYSGRIIASSEAEKVGLITSVWEDPLDAARGLAAEIAGKSPDAIRAIKGLINNAWHDSVEGALQREAELQIKVMATPNHTEAVKANLEKRSAEFLDTGS